MSSELNIPIGNKMSAIERVSELRPFSPGIPSSFWFFGVGVPDKLFFQIRPIFGGVKYAARHCRTTGSQQDLWGATRTQNQRTDKVRARLLRLTR